LPSRRRALDAHAFEQTGVPLLSDFCVPTFPDIRRVCGPGTDNTFADDILSPGPIGPAGRVSVVTADAVDRAAQRFGAHADSIGQVATRIRTPVRTFFATSL